MVSWMVTIFTHGNCLSKPQHRASMALMVNLDLQDMPIQLAVVDLTAMLSLSRDSSGYSSGTLPPPVVTSVSVYTSRRKLTFGCLGGPKCRNFFGCGRPEDATQVAPLGCDVAS